MNSIETYKDLMAEKSRLESVLATHKILINKDLGELKHQLDPVANLVSVAKKFLTRDKDNPLIKVGVNVAGDILLRKFLLARAGWLAKLVVPYLLKNYSSHLLNKRLSNIKLNNIKSPGLNGNGNFLQRLGDKLKK